MASEILRLTLDRDRLTGELAVDLPPGTPADQRDRILAALLGDRLDALAADAGVTLAAGSSAFAFVQPGKDDAGRTRFQLRGRVEGDRLLPVRNPRGA